MTSEVVAGVFETGAWWRRRCDVDVVKCFRERWTRRDVMTAVFWAAVISVPVQGLVWAVVR